MLLRRGKRRPGVPFFPLLLALLVAFIPTFHATPLTTQVTVEMTAAQAARDIENNNSTTTGNAENEMEIHNDARRLLTLLPFDDRPDTRRLQLPLPFDIPGFGGDMSNFTCPESCPLCQCNSTDDTECLLEKSVEACASNSFETCVAGILPGDFDIAGLCAVTCGDSDGAADEEATSQSRQTCQICNIFSCCNECPSERAAECFPPIEYTPAGWAPADCSGGAVGAVIGFAGSLMMVASSFVVFGLFT